jgi:hypothetical protein
MHAFKLKTKKQDQHVFQRSHLCTVIVLIPVYWEWLQSHLHAAYLHCINSSFLFDFHV